jgi:DeoR family glycerol-3-phosphate regulon repressor
MTNKKKTGVGDQSDRWRLLATGPAQARRRALEEVIQERGFVSVSDIALEIGVSEMTVRRDLLALEQNGRIERAHGGALPTARPTALQVEPSFATRQDQQAEAKAAIARAAAGLIGDREIVGLDVGSTVARLARELSGRQKLGIVTNSLQAVAALAQKESMMPDVYVLGGHLRPRESSLSGRVARKQLREYWLSKVFIGVAAIGIDGLYDYVPEEAEIKGAFIERASEVIILCDSSKFEQRSFVRVCGLDAVTTLVTEKPPTPALQSALDRNGVRVLIATTSEGPDLPGKT